MPDWKVLKPVRAQKEKTMRRSTFHYGVIVLAVGFVGLFSARANAQGEERSKQIELISPPYGIASGQTVSVSVVVYANRTLSTDNPVIARIQLLDTEGDVIAQLDELRVEPGKIRFRDVPRDLLPAGEPAGRVQVRTRIVVTTEAGFASSLPVAAAVELTDIATGRASVIWVKRRIRQQFPGGS